MQDVNRLKIVMVEQKKGGIRDIDNIVEGYPSKWLSEELKVSQSTVSKWCTNTSQPDLPTLIKIASILNVDIKDLLNSTKV